MPRALVFSAATVVASLAAAYSVDARTVFRHFAERQALERTTSAVLVGRGLLAGPEGGSAREVPARVDLSATGQCKLRLELPEGNVAANYAGGKLTEEGTSAPALAALATLGCPLLVLRNVPASEAEVAVTRFAGHLGVELGTVTLSRLDRRAAFVVGAHPRDSEHPQIWFDKETSRPVRVIGRVGGQTFDVRFEDPASLATNRRAPRVAEVWKGNERLLSIRLMTGEAEGVPSGPAPLEEGDEDQE